MPIATSEHLFVAWARHRHMTFRDGSVSAGPDGIARCDYRLAIFDRGPLTLGSRNVPRNPATSNGGCLAPAGAYFPDTSDSAGMQCRLVFRIAADPDRQGNSIDAYDNPEHCPGGQVQPVRSLFDHRERNDVTDERFARGMKALNESTAIPGSAFWTASPMSPALAEQIVSWGFGEIFSRPGLALRDRQFVTLGRFNQLIITRRPMRQPLPLGVPAPPTITDPGITRSALHLVVRARTR
jgi:hypothetical protein